ncbi:uncharacterized protein LOC136090956 [Hydra vulgaris]|uniref:Uncharacterized protein LOC136090956 n=1 Tax=Hydra vulgaris TaxID=6087 RepID=A0ABM4DHR0_HYDVU
MATQPTIIRSCLLYEFKLGRNATQAAKNICTAFGEGTVSERTAQKWFQRFSSGDESIEDLPRSGRPLLVDEDELKDAVESDSSQTCQELAVRHFEEFKSCYAGSSVPRGEEFTMSLTRPISVDLFVDKILVAKDIPDFLCGVAMVIAAYFLFDIADLKPLVKTLNFIDHHITSNKVKLRKTAKQISKLNKL